MSGDGEGFEEFANGAGERLFRSVKVSAGEREDERVERDLVVHTDGGGFALEKATRDAVEGEVDFASVDTVVVGLGVEDAVDDFAGVVLVGVTAKVGGELREFAGECADAVGVIVAAGEAHVPGEEDGVGLEGGDFAQEGAESFHGIKGLETAEFFQRQPGCKCGGGEAEDGDAEASDFLEEIGAQAREWSGGVTEMTDGFASDHGIAGKDGHGGELDAVGEDVEAIARESLAPFDPPEGENPYAIHEDLRTMMQRRVGIVRSEEDLLVALDELDRLRARARRVKAGGNIQYNPGWHLALDLKNMIDISEAVTRAALARTESRGAHTREDYPDSDKDWGRRNVIVRKKGDALLVAEEPLPDMPDELKALLNLSD